MRARAEVQTLLSPGLREAPVLDRMCSQFVLALTLRNAALQVTVEDQPGIGYGHRAV